MWFIITLIILISVVFGVITTLPFVLITLLCISVVYKTRWIFVLAFFAGLYLDIVFVRSLGQSSVFYLIFIFLIFLYDRKFEIRTTPFVFLSSFLGTLSYFLIFGYDYIIWQALVSSLIAVLIFKLLARKLLHSI